MEEKELVFKYSTITDPENADLEELKKEIYRLNDLSRFYNSKQDSIKRFINSVYGACASKYFECHNVNVAEAITLQGQDLNHYTENAINAYFRGIFQNDTKLHQELGIDTEKAKQVKISGGRMTVTPPLLGPQFKYLDGNESMVVAGDTDSVSGNSIVYINNEKMKIEEAFNDIFKRSKFIKHEPDNFVIEPFEYLTTKTYDSKTKKVENRKINYLMRHKVSKPRWKVKTKSGKIVEVTDDHSIMVLRNGKLIETKASLIDIKTDKIITITHQEYKNDANESN